MHNLEYKCTFGLEHPVELLDVVGDELLVRDVGGGGDLQGSWAGGQDSGMKAFRILRIQDSGFRGSGIQGCLEEGVYLVYCGLFVLCIGRESSRVHREHVRLEL